MLWLGRETDVNYTEKERERDVWKLKIQLVYLMSESSRYLERDFLLVSFDMWSFWFIHCGGNFIALLQYFLQICLHLFY